MTYALIPVKELSQAKARLSPVLDVAGRRTLALAMFRDVLAAALDCDAIEGVAVVSRDEEILAEASAAGAEAMPEPGGLNEALDSAAKRLTRRGIDRAAVAAADLPLATPDAIGAVIAAGVEVALVPSLDGGTNLLVTPPDAFPFLFGKESARRHLAEARSIGLEAMEFRLAGLELDIDSPEQLDRLRAIVLGRSHAPLGEEVRCGTNTSEALTSLGLIGQAVP